MAPAKGNCYFINIKVEFPKLKEFKENSQNDNLKVPLKGLKMLPHKSQGSCYFAEIKAEFLKLKKFKENFHNENIKVPL